MRPRHPVRLIARLACSFLEVFPVDYEALDAYLTEAAAKEAEAQAQASQRSDGLRALGPETAR